MVGMLRLLVVLFALIFPAARQADSEWAVLEVTAFTDPLKHESYETSFLLSPDGTMLAWLETRNKLCLMALPSAVRLCRPLPEQYTELTLLNWSPDNQYLLLRNGIGEFSTHHHYAPETNKFELLTNHESVRSRLIWDPSDTIAEVYYLTYQYERGVEFTVLHRYSVATGEDAIFDPQTVFNAPQIFTGVVPVSSDATRFVLMMQYSISPDIPSGLWLIDTAALQTDHLATYSDLEVGVSRSYSSSILDLVWDRERNRLLVPTVSMEGDTAVFTLTSIDLETGELLPLLTMHDALTLTGDSSFTHGYITPDAEFFFYLDTTDQSRPGQKTIFALPLSPQVSEPIIITEDYNLTCPRTALLVRLARDDIERKYLYEPHITCR